MTGRLRRRSDRDGRAGAAHRRLAARILPRPWFRSLSRASYFSLLVQRKDNQKKAHPVGRARRFAPGPQVSRGFSTGHPCPVEKRAASCRAPCGPDPRNPPRPGAPVSQDQDQKRLRVKLKIAVFLREIRGDTSGLGAPFPAISGDFHGKHGAPRRTLLERWRWTMRQRTADVAGCR